MNFQEITIVSQIRKLGKGSRGRDTFVNSVSDEAIYEMFLQLKSGSTNRSVARFLLTTHGVRSSENSLQQGIGKLRKRIATLLTADPISRVTTDMETRIADAQRLPPEKRLIIIRQIEQDYFRSIEMATAEAKNRGILIHDLPKHLAAVTALSKSADDLEKDVAAMDLAERKALWEKEFKENSDVVLDWLHPHRDRLVIAADKLLRALKDRCVKLELDPETGQYYDPGTKNPNHTNSTASREIEANEGFDGTTTI